MSRPKRQRRWAELPSLLFDVAIVGGGIHGACLFHQLGRAGYRVLLVEARDYAGGTSQSSAMMIWGGLLYLRNADLATVWSLTRSREELLASHRAVRPLTIRYVGDGPRATRSALIRGALTFYWLLGGCRRRRPTLVARFPEQALLRLDLSWPAVLYEEGCIDSSDSRFVLEWILHGQGWAFNYCRLAGGGYDAARRLWQLELEDGVGGQACTASARWVINAAGVWSDRINATFGIKAPYRNLFSKGVFLVLPRAEHHEAALVLGDDFMAWLPWGPVSLWGPTETVLPDLDQALTLSPMDVRFLLDELNRHTRRGYAPTDVIALRSGVRPIAIPRDRPDIDSRGLSRASRLWFDPQLPWACVHGGNITGALGLAQRTVRALRARLTPACAPLPDHDEMACLHNVIAERTTFPGLPGDFPTPAWCAAHEDCWDLADYLRRRTNIAQWTVRGGLGAGDVHREQLHRWARVIHSSGAEASKAVERYREGIVRHLDELLRYC
jgi:glycerol-3-phosphate dehydrogenase